MSRDPPRSQDGSTRTPGISPGRVVPTLRAASAWLRHGIPLLGIAAVYVLTARAGLTLALPPEQKATVVWPPSGIALAAVLLGGARMWPGIWMGAFLANVLDLFNPSSHVPLATQIAVSAGIASGSTLQPLLGGYLLRRWLGHRAILDSARGVFLFVGVALLSCVTAATIGVGSLRAAGFAPWSAVAANWWTWWLGDSVGILVVTPLILVWRSVPPVFPGTARVAEAGLLAGLVLTVGLFIFSDWRPHGNVTAFQAYMTIPLLIWAAFRFGPHGATALLLLVSGLAVSGTAQGHGPFVGDTLNNSLLLLQTFVAVLAVTALALAGVLAERRQADLARTALIEELRRAGDAIRIGELLEEQIHRLARELHDEAGQLLTSVHLALHDVARGLPPATRERLTEIGALLDRIELQLRRLSHELRPAILDDLGLVPAIRFLSDGVSQRSGIAIRVNASTRGRLPREIENTLYRVVQEALSNSARHSRASRAAVSLRQEGGLVRCSIWDDGVGLTDQGGPSSERERGIGLAGIRERVAPLSGTVEIQSGNRRGTEVSVTIPMEASNGGTGPPGR